MTTGEAEVARDASTMEDGRADHAWNSHIQGLGRP
jgi:hypothetical protein